jgi:hypothetical protein
VTNGMLGRTARLRSESETARERERGSTVRSGWRNDRNPVVWLVLMRPVPDASGSSSTGAGLGTTCSRVRVRRPTGPPRRAALRAAPRQRSRLAA